MSDTPITDAAECRVAGPNAWSDRDYPAVPSMVSRQLERGIAELTRKLTAGPDKVLRCAFCGEPYPEGTPTHKSEALAAHIRVCKEHPIGKENRSLRAVAQDFIDNIEVPAPNCSCHLSSPCSDCVEYGALRELIASAKATLSTKA